MSRKRDKPYLSSHPPYPKRRHPLPPPSPPPPPPPPQPSAKPPPPPGLVVMGLPPGCSVLDLKSRFEIYGPISRIRIERDGVGYVAFRSKDAADSAVSASLDPSFGITIDSKRLQVLWATDPLAQWREGVVGGGKKDNVHAPPPSPSSSKLLRAEVPLSRRGRGNYKLASAIVNPRIGSISGDGNGKGKSSGDVPSLLNAPFKAREIIAYDDII